MTSQLDRHSETDPKPEMLSAVYAGNRICRDERNVRGIGHATLPNHIPACRSEVFFKSMIWTFFS